MKISLKESASILSLTNDELMYLNQKQRIKVTVNQDTLNWEFYLADILLLKEALDLEAQIVEDAIDD
jgi:hypothetical protein